jgi:hypothetical protein
MHVDLYNGEDEHIGTAVMDADGWVTMKPGPGETQEEADYWLSIIPVEHRGEDFPRLLPGYFNGQGVRGVLVEG